MNILKFIADKVTILIDKSMALTEVGILEKYMEGVNTLLDVGCGSGVVGQTISKKFATRVVGTDIEDFRKVELEFVKSNGVRLPFHSKEFDGVLLSFVLHHTKRNLEIIKEAKRVAKKIFIFEDTPESFWEKIKSHAHGIAFKFAYGLKEDYQFRTQEGWKNVFTKSGLKLIDCKKVYYFNPVYNLTRYFFMLSV